ncbi:MAG: hypothetical protein KC593_13195 [Myxococcales bacterium]|nr:hypothetical protein [Myxococcales bacterium]MCB9629831.1 hypothetical protein [Sandaracinaceae bacterium]
MNVSRLSLTVLLVASLCSGSCASPEPSRTYHFVFDQLVLGVAEPDGEEMVSDGLDLDGSDGPVSLPDGAPNPCSSHGDDPDYVSREGERGVDNRLGGQLEFFARILSGGDGTNTERIRSIFQESISAGLLIVLVEFDGVDSLLNDDNVMARLYIGTGSAVAVGTDGRLLSGQTFLVNPDIPSVAQRVRIVDGVVELQGVQTRLVGAISGIDLDMPMTSGRLRLTFHGDEVVTGVLGGALDWGALADVVGMIGGAADGLTVIARRTLQGLADVVNPETGECDGLSASFRVHGVPAFIYPSEVAAGDGVPGQRADAGL